MRNGLFVSDVIRITLQYSQFSLGMNQTRILVCRVSYCEREILSTEFRRLPGSIYQGSSGFLPTVPTCSLLISWCGEKVVLPAIDSRVSIVELMLYSLHFGIDLQRIHIRERGRTRHVLY